MQDCDHDVVVLSLKRARDQLSWQARKGLTIADLQRHYANVKRVRQSHVNVHCDTLASDAINKDMKLSIMVRGWMMEKYSLSIIVKGTHHRCRCNGTVGSLLERMGPYYNAIW